MPDAARISDFHICPKAEPGPVPHVGGPIFSGSADVVIGFLPAAREGDSLVCFPLGPADRIKQGSSTVLINHRPAARRTDPGSHTSGDLIAAGCPTVVIGDSPQSFTFRAAARRGTPLCEECERKHRKMDDRDDWAEPGPPEADTVTLDDEEGPDSARSSRNPFAGLGATTDELAAQPDLADDLSELRKAARFAVAFQFYAANVEERVKPSRILSHIKCIDLSRSVSVRPVVGEYSISAGTGQYLTIDLTLTPEQFGSPSAYGLVGGRPEPPPVSRRLTEITFGDQPALALHSTAAIIVDDWSYKQKDWKPSPDVSSGGGGGPQLMIPKKFYPPTS
ncbi:PAAR domain-containing protein [Nannocystis pusilla]|uniref:PAAR domain-containing protein n=1 Tax=Nannocystis pusilla TaxID=889268 RepID=UPI003BF2CA7F